MSRVEVIGYPENPPRNGVQLGCGTLLIIAIIVMFFSGGSDTKEMKARLNDMAQKIDRLEQKIDALTEKLNPPQPTAERP